MQDGDVGGGIQERLPLEIEHRLRLAPGMPRIRRELSLDQALRAVPVDTAQLAGSSVVERRLLRAFKLRLIEIAVKISVDD